MNTRQPVAAGTTEESGLGNDLGRQFEEGGLRLLQRGLFQRGLLSRWFGVLSYENPPLLLADKLRIVQEDGTVYFTVGGADPQDFYQTDVWGGFDPHNDQGRSRDEMSESYQESCEREIRNLIGNAVPKNFSWDDLLRFVPEGEQFIAVTPEYRSKRMHRPASVILLLSNDEMVRLRLF